MEKTCSNCRYYALSIHAIPCSECKDHSCWAPYIEGITDQSEKLNAVLENQAILLLEIGRLKTELNNLVEIVKERCKE